ncbi:glutaredoxin family protein [Spiribacter halobius]|uniref:Glutaredoxin n=1 Tax=Sediminicurvatus halobius TaxID=2182432 RepID=A0A2U2N4R2_9GAMM|nr:glutathione S-transferase N-terminal domain-containing protein [Spiribacter halobius]PWG64037.1 glutaredoxin [Spiribacter halobius]UEX76908.1 glutathione S-transferase N-terminal domain-containing protein [Spiribacter halobius]
MFDRLKAGVDVIRKRAGVAVRNDAAQAEVDRSAQQLTLYYRPTCPFCIKVFIALRRLDVPVQRRNIGADDAARRELVAEGGRQMVPCLRIEEGEQPRWLYESDDIIAYLESRFGTGRC